MNDQDPIEIALWIALAAIVTVLTLSMVYLFN